MKQINVKPHVTETMPESVYTYDTLVWMDPGSKSIQDHTYEVVMDIVNRYDVDGIHFDDYFYPYPKPQAFPDDKTYAAYTTAGGKLGKEDWRRDNVNNLVHRIHDGIKAKKPYVRFGISPFGIYKSGTPEGTRGLDQYSAIFADPKKWMDEKWVDYLAPQLYWKLDSKNTPFEKLLVWWAASAKKCQLTPALLRI